MVSTVRPSFIRLNYYAVSHFCVHSTHYMCVPTHFRYLYSIWRLSLRLMPLHFMFSSNAPLVHADEMEGAMIEVLKNRKVHAVFDSTYTGFDGGKQITALIWICSELGVSVVAKVWVTDDNPNTDYYANKLSEEAKRWGVKVKYVAADNTALMPASISKAGYLFVPCLSHFLNLVSPLTACGWMHTLPSRVASSAAWKRQSRPLLLQRRPAPSVLRRLSLLDTARMMTTSTLTMTRRVQAVTTTVTRMSDLMDVCALLGLDMQAQPRACVCMHVADAMRLANSLLVVSAVTEQRHEDRPVQNHCQCRHSLPVSTNIVPKHTSDSYQAPISAICWDLTFNITKMAREARQKNPEEDLQNQKK